jgi:hypothetical protein
MTIRNDASLRRLTDAELRQAAGGLLLPAVQKVREAAGRVQAALLLPAVQKVEAAGVRVAGGDLNGDGRAD